MKKEFVITEIVHMNAGVSSEKENIKESQLRRVTPSPDTPSGAGSGASHEGTKVDERICNRTRIVTSYKISIGICKV